MRKRNIEKALAKAAEAIDGIAYRLNSPSTNGLTDWLVLFPSGICVFVDLKATRKKRRILQQKRAKQLSALGFPVLCIDRKLQME